MFDWDNLFLACGHCNNTKRDAYPGILDCTDENDKVDADLRYRFEPFPSAKVEIDIRVDNDRTRMTKALLMDIYNGTTPLKKLEASHLRGALREEMATFLALLDRFRSHGEAGEADARLAEVVEEHLDNASGFTAFKRWAIRDDAALRARFAQSAH